MPLAKKAGRGWAKVGGIIQNISEFNVAPIIPIKFMVNNMGLSYNSHLFPCFVVDVSPVGLNPRVPSSGTVFYDIWKLSRQ